VLIEATQPVAYSVSRPDALTLFVDLRNVTVGDAGAKITPNGRQTGPLAGVTIEQAAGVGGESLARVRVALASPAGYQVKGDRKVIRLDLEPGKTESASAAAAPDGGVGGTPAARADGITASDKADVTTAAATRLEKVRTAQSKTATTVTLAGNGRLTPSSL